MKRYLICSADESVAVRLPTAVHAETADEAIEKYLRAVHSREEHFRDSVLDLAVNMTFVEQFYIASPPEHARFDKTETVAVEGEIVRSRVRAFFADRPDLGSKFIDYMDTENQSLIDDELFEFIAVKETATSAGITVIDPEQLTEVL